MSSLTVAAFNGSPRKNGNTARMLARACAELEAENIAVKHIHMGGNKVRGCIGCRKCQEKNLGQCVLDDDPINSWIAEMKKADGILLGSPTYFANVTTEMKAFIDRAGFSARHFLYRKAGAPVVAVRRSGAMQVYSALMTFFGISQMVVPCSSYWNMGIGLNPGDVENDVEGMETMANLGKNMAWTLKKLNA